VTSSPPIVLIALSFLSSWSLPAAALDTTREDVRGFIDEMQREHDFDARELERLLAGAQIKQSILDAMSRPAERVTPWHEYRAQFLTPKRIQQGKDFWREHAQQLTGFEDDELADIVVGILGVETHFGRLTGKFRVVDALATLAFDYPPRGQFFRDQLQQFLLLTREEKIDASTALGSYAGAMGSPQFISSSYRKYAVDADGDGRRDLWSNWDDIISSIANYLRAHGWRSGEQVVVPATLGDADLSRFTVGKVDLNETVQSLRDKGVRFKTRQPPDAPAMLIEAQGKNGPEYRIGFHNFYVVTRYNRSIMYSMAVHDLGHAVQPVLEAKRQ
jgi:membrane-bound lytic murein transglycosylase B